MDVGHNSSTHPWEQICADLEGARHTHNESLDHLKLQEEILHIQNAHQDISALEVWSTIQKDFCIFQPFHLG